MQEYFSKVETPEMVADEIMSDPSMDKLLWTKEDVRKLLIDVISKYVF